MSIEEYLKLTGLSMHQLALITGVSVQSLYKYASGAIPFASTAEKIEKATGGKIKASILLQGKK